MFEKLITSTSSLITMGERRLSILIYHRVLESYDFMRPDEVTANEFDKQMGLVSKYFNPIPLTVAIEKLQNNTLPTRAICITFDDGYRDNAEIAYPILKKWNIPATFFIASGFLDGGRMWNDTVIETIRSYSGEKFDLSSIGLGIFDCSTNGNKEKSCQEIIRKIKHCSLPERTHKVDYIASFADNLPNDLMMDSQQVKKISESGVEIGGHTVSHPILATLPDVEAEQEISKGKEALEQIIQKEITLFAFPNGKPKNDYLLKHVDMVRRLGFKAAVSTNWGVSNKNSDMHQLNRFTPWDKTEKKFLLRLVRNLGSVS